MRQLGNNFFGHQRQTERRSNFELEREGRATQVELNSWSSRVDGGRAGTEVRYVIEGADGGSA